MNDEGKDLQPLFDTILERIPAPEGDPDGGLQIMVTTLEADDYLGKVAIGRVTRGTVKQGMAVAITDGENPYRSCRTAFQLAGNETYSRRRSRRGGYRGDGRI